MNQIRSYEKYAVNIAVFGLDYLVKFRFKIRQLSHRIKVCNCKSCNFNKQTSNKMIRTYVHMPNKAKYLSNTRWSLTFYAMYAKLQLLRDVTIVLLGSDIVALLS